LGALPSITLKKRMKDYFASGLAEIIFVPVRMLSEPLQVSDSTFAGRIYNDRRKLVFVDSAKLGRR